MLTQEMIASIEKTKYRFLLSKKHAKKYAAEEREMIKKYGQLIGIRYWVDMDHPSPWFVSF